MDIKKAKLLYYLDYNARSNLSDLSKKLQLSKQNIEYKIKKLNQEGIIEKYISVIDIHRLGYFTFRVYIRLGKVTEEDISDIINYLKNNPHILWLVTISGNWDFEIVFVAKNYIEFERLFNNVRQYLGERLIKYNISMSIVNLHYRKDYLIDNKRNNIDKIASYGHASTMRKIDETDIKILIELSENCRRSNLEVGKKLGISYHTVKSRIQKMEKEGIIQAHRTKIHIQKLGYKHMKAALYINPVSEEKEEQLINFISSFPNVTYIVKILGEWQIEIEVEVEDEKKLTEILKNIRNNYPELINDYFFFEVTREIKLNYFPNAELLLKK